MVRRVIDFMVIGLPRSCTTWAANFFTTDKSICLHDPLYQHHYNDLDKLKFPGKKLGVSCTGLWRFPQYLNSHPAPKIILRRPLTEVNGSMADIGLPSLSEVELFQLAGIQGEHYHFLDLFNPFYAGMMCSRIGLEFDVDRHAELCQIEMQPKFSGLSISPEVTRTLIAELRAISRGAE